MATPLSYIELSTSALHHNLEQFKNLIPNSTAISAVIKGNAYGHGMPELIQMLEGKVDYMQVDDVEELTRLRQISNSNALVLGYVQDDDLLRCVELKAELAGYSLHQLQLLNRIGKQRNQVIPVHLKIDALLGRMGVLPNQIADVTQALQSLPNIKMAGVYSHYSNIEDTTNLQHANAQLALFESTIQQLRGHGIAKFATHISATSGILCMPQEHSMVRLGLGIYGMWPSQEIADRFQNQLQLQPILRWISHVAAVKTLPANHPIGYGLSYVTPHKMKVAVIPQGYSDGYDRGLSNRGQVLIAGKRCSVLGRVAMNMIVADVSHRPNLQPEAEVVLLGNQGDERITAEEIAAQIDTINYEVTTKISPLLPRIIVE